MVTLVKKQQGASKKVTASSPEKRKTAKVRDTSPITMPKHRNIPPKDFRDYSGMIYGEKAIGKTSLLSELVDVIMMTERGRKNLPILQIPDHSRKEPPLTWERTLEYRDLFLKEKPRNIGVDTLDRHYELCNLYTCAQFGVKKPSDAGSESHAVWTQMKREYEEWAVSLIEAGISIIWTSHARVRDVHARVGQGFQQVCPTCSDAPWNIVKSLTDYGIYYGYYGRERGLQIRGNSLVWCGCNLDGHFLDPKSKEQLEAFDAGGSAKQAAKNLLASYDNKLAGIVFDPTEPGDEEEESDDES